MNSLRKLFHPLFLFCLLAVDVINAKEERTFPNDLKLSDALSRPSQSQIATSISQDGSGIYLVYDVSFTPGGIVAELFKTNMAN